MPVEETEDTIPSFMVIQNGENPARERCGPSGRPHPALAGSPELSSLGGRCSGFELFSRAPDLDFTRQEDLTWLHLCRSGIPSP